jgi:hypothetical protein
MRFVLALVAVAVVASSVSPAYAGLKCIKQPDYIFIAPGASLDDRAHWRRSTGEETRAGTLSHEAFALITAISLQATSAQMTRCLDALIADEHGKTAKRACAKARQ